uniref:MATH domain-containing protein n=1 Tax=Panagrolaimus davidi TaxID=227884 RepID=A0A914Q1I6_9BILA
MNSSFNEIVCPFEAEWKFHKADLLDLKNSEDGCLNGKCCYAYNIPGLKYFVAIYINGNAKGSCGQTWIAFHVNGSEDRKVTAEFTLSVESANHSKNLNYVYEKSIGHGTYFCKTEKFFNSKFFVNGELTIKVKGTLKTERPLISKICAPISMQWKVKEADLKSKKESSGCLYSKRINVASFSGVKYYLAIRPKFIIDENESRTQLCLHLSMEKKKKIEAVYDFSIDSANFNCGSQYVYDKSKGHGLRLYSTEDIFDPSKKYIVDGYLTINLNGILIAEKNQLFTSISENDIEPKFNLKILAAKSVIDAKDFKILIDENEIPVSS